MVFTHGIDSILRSIHEWITEFLPSGNILKHDFKDGRGPVSAIPCNSGTFEDTNTSMIVDNAPVDSGTFEDTIISTSVDNSPADSGTFEDTTFLIEVL